MSILLALTIVAFNGGAPMEARYPGATEVFHCPFDASWDKNYDHWPDEWSRRKGRGFPRYVKVEISEEPTPAGERSLRIDVNGGAVALYSPPIPIGPLHRYVLEGLVATEGLEQDRACFSLSLLDSQRNRLETRYSERTQPGEGWQKLPLGPVAPDGDDARFAVIGLHLEPGPRPDLTGTVRFGEVWLGRLPRIRLWAGNRHHVFTDPDEATVTFGASGLSDENPPVVFRLEDALGTLVAEERLRLKTSLTSGGPLPSSEAASHEPPDRVGSVPWAAPISGPGFYRVKATLRDGSTAVHRRQLNLAVIRPQPGPPGGEFGWTLPDGGKPLSLEELSQLACEAAIGWVKYPLWCDDQISDERAKALIRFRQELASQGIELVGLLHDPPEVLQSQLRDGRSPAEILTGDAALWYPSLEAAISRMAIQVRWWQLGQDKDPALAGYPNLAEKIAQIKTQLEMLGHDVGVGFGWDWREPFPDSGGGEPAWQFLALSTDPPLTCEKLSGYLDATRNAPFRRWATLEPLPQDRHPLEARVGDLVQKMTAAKIHGADGIFIPDLFSTDHGLMNDDGSVGELFLPWRTAASMLRGAQYLGSIQLPEGSENHVFTRGLDAVMLVRDETPKREAIHLGGDVRQVDLWGRRTTPKQQEHRQLIEVATLPTFVTGLDERIVRWRQSLSLASDRMPSIVGGSHQNRLHLNNTFGREVSGHLELVAPASWQVDPQRVDFRLQANEALEKDFRVTLPYNAESGCHSLRFDFEIQAEKTYRFSVHRQMDVGPSDVSVEIVTRLNERGELEVEQHLTNETDEAVSFRCELAAPEQRRQRMHVLHLKRGRHLSTYRLPDGAQLLGKTLWLRVEEIGGPRVLNYRFVAKR